MIRGKVEGRKQDVLCAGCQTVAAAWAWWERGKQGEGNLRALDCRIQMTCHWAAGVHEVFWGRSEEASGSLFPSPSLDYIVALGKVARDDRGHCFC